MQAAFRHFAPACRVHYGDGCLKQLASELQRIGARRAVVFCGGTLSRAAPGLETVRAALGGLFAGAFTGVAEHSPIPAVEAGAQALREFGADAVIALGGGSAIVTARAAAIVLAEEKSPHELCTVFPPGKAPVSPKLERPKLPQFIVPTTPTSAYAKTGAAVSVPGEGKRLALFDPKVRAQAIFFEPAFFNAAPAKLILEAAIDAFALSMQGLESNRREPLADALLLHAVKLIRRHLPRDGAEARGQLMLAALLAGQGTDFTAAGAASAIGHSIGARYRLANGVVNAIVLPHMVRFNAPATRGRMGDVAEALGEAAEDDGAAEAVGRACAAFFAAVGLPNSLREIGVAAEDFAHIAEEISGDWFFSQNPKPMGREDLIKLLNAAW